jgi:hypothetical protein
MMKVFGTRKRELGYEDETVVKNRWEYETTTVRLS